MEVRLRFHKGFSLRASRRRQLHPRPKRTLSQDPLDRRRGRKSTNRRQLHPGRSGRTGHRTRTYPQRSCAEAPGESNPRIDAPLSQFRAQRSQSDGGTTSLKRRLVLRRVVGSYLMAVKHNAQKIRIVFLQDVIGAVVSKVDSPVLKNTACRTVLLRIIGSRNPLLQKLTKNLRSVEGGSACVGARDYRPRGCITNAAPGRTVGLSKVARIIVQDVRQQTKNKKGGSSLVRFRSSNSLRLCTPALPVMRLPIAGLLQSRLKGVAKVRAEVHRLVPCKDILLSYRQRLLHGWSIVRRLKIGNDSQDSLGIIVLLRMELR